MGPMLGNIRCDQHNVTQLTVLLCMTSVQTSFTAIMTSIKINEVGCRDDTVPKTVETRKPCKED